MSSFWDFFKIVFDAVFVIQVLVISLSLVILFYKDKITVKNILIALLKVAILSVAATFLNALTFYLFSFIRMFTSASYTAAYVILFAGYYFFIKESHESKTITLFSFLTTEVLSTEFASHLMRYFERRSSAEGVNYSWISIVSYILILIVAIIMRAKTMMKFKNIQKSIPVLVVISSVIIISVVRFYTIYKNYTNDMEPNILAIFFFLSLYLINIATYLLSYGACMEKQALLEYMIENEEMYSDKEMMRVSQQTYNDIRSIRHDIKNQFGIMNLLLKEKKYDELDQYFNDLTNSMSFSVYKVDCGNEKFNAVLNMEISKAKAYNIFVSTNLAVPPKTPFHSSDICSILANLMDNSIEYLHGNKISDKPINIDIYPKGEFLYIGVCNFTELEDSENPDMSTKKDDGKFHGIGHKIVKRIAKKYNGFANFSVSEHNFIAEVMLDLNYKESE